MLAMQTPLTRILGLRHPVLLAPMAGVPLIMQVQSLTQAREALAIGADILAAQACSLLNGLSQIEIMSKQG